MSKKLKEKKQQERKNKAKARVLAKRHKLRQVQKEARELEKAKEHFRPRALPIRNDRVNVTAEPAMTEQMSVDDPRRVDWVKRKLEHNYAILEALEKEMESEEAARDEVKKNLAAQGATTLKDQMDLLGEKAHAELGIDMNLAAKAE